MIAEVVVGIAKHDVECHSAIKFSEILAHIGTPTKDEINNVKIAVACAAANSISWQASHRARRLSIGGTRNFALAFI